MNDINNNLNDTKYLLEDSECKSINIEDYSNYNNNNFNNTQLLLEDKFDEIPENINNNINNNEGAINKEMAEKNINNFINESKPNIDNSIKDIMIQNNINEEKEKAKDEQEIIKQQNILLNNQSSHLEELFSLSYTDISHNNPSLKLPPMNKIIPEKNTNSNVNIIKNNLINKDIQKINDIDNVINDKKIFFGTLFPTEQITKIISYKNDNKKKIICFQIAQNKNNKYSEYFKILIDNNKNYFNLKPNEEIKIKILLEVPLIKIKKQIFCELYVKDINNNLVGTFYLYANIEIPKFCCLRYKNLLKECNIPLIRIYMKYNDNQKFLIPFKNLSLRDLKIDFCLLSSPNREDNISKYIDYEINFDSETNFIIPSCEVNYFELEINIKNKNELAIKENKNNILIIKKIIQAKIVGTKIYYYFCLELRIE